MVQETDRLIENEVPFSMFDEVEFKEDGFYLNGQKVKYLKALNVNASVGETTQVTITFHADVKNIEQWKQTAKGNRFTNKK